MVSATLPTDNCDVVGECQKSTQLTMQVQQDWMRGPANIFFDLTHDCMIYSCNSFVTIADDLHDPFHLPACLARVPH